MSNEQALREFEEKLDEILDWYDDDGKERFLRYVLDHVIPRQEARRQALSLPTDAPDKDSLNKLVEIMRWVDAYAVDYATEGKLAKSRQDVEREIARNVAPRVTTEMFDQLKSNLELIQLSQKTLEDANALIAAPVGEREALLCDLRTWHAMLNQLDPNARATLTSETAAELLGRAIEALALPTQQSAGDDVDPLQGAAEWIVQALSLSKATHITEIQQRLLVGFNRASRLYDAARGKK